LTGVTVTDVIVSLVVATPVEPLLSVAVTVIVKELAVEYV
jgi:hypothetical protein